MRRRVSEGNVWGAYFHTRMLAYGQGLRQWFRTAEQLRAAGYERDGIRMESTAISPLQRALDRAGGAMRRRSTCKAARRAAPERYVPLYEAKMIHQFDHRWAIYDTRWRDEPRCRANREGRPEF